MIKPLAGMTALVTGGSSGIGAETVRLLAREGANVGIHCFLGRERLRPLEEEIEGTEGLHRIYEADLSSPGGPDTLFDRFVQDYGQISLLVNNAGNVIGSKGSDALTIEEWDRTFALNARAPFLLSRRAFALMKSHGGGRIVNISSVSAKYGGSPATMHYGASKAALEALTIGLSRAGAQYQILVNAIRCGFIDTAFHARMGRSEEDIKRRVQMIPLKRAGTPRNIADTVVFLAGPTGDFITGEILSVAGGD